MSEPLIQVVDDNDRPVRAATKEEVWKSGEIHRIACVIVEDKQGHLLFQKRPDTMELSPGCWDCSVGGHVDAGETYEQAAKREGYEEIGLQNIKLKELGRFYNGRSKDGRKLNRFYKVFRSKIQNRSDINHDDHEVAYVRWFSLNEAKKLLQEKSDNMTNALQEVLKRYYS